MPLSNQKLLNQAMSCTGQANDELVRLVDVIDQGAVLTDVDVHRKMCVVVRCLSDATAAALALQSRASGVPAPREG